MRQNLAVIFAITWQYKYLGLTETPICRNNWHWYIFSLPDKLPRYNNPMSIYQVNPWYKAGMHTLQLWGSSFCICNWPSWQKKEWWQHNKYYTFRNALWEIIISFIWVLLYIHKRELIVSPKRPNLQIYMKNVWIQREIQESLIWEKG